MRKFLFIFLFLVADIVFLIGYAFSPYVSDHEFPISNIVKFEIFPSPRLLRQAQDKLSPARGEGNKIKIATYNIGYAWGDKNNQKIHPPREELEKNLQEMATALKKLDADILCLQEVDFKSARTFDINQFEYLAKALQMPYGAYAVTWNKRYLPWPYWPPKAHYGHILSGQAILSRFPLENHSIYQFEKPASNPFWYNWFYLDRIAQKVSVQIGSKKLALWNVHLEAFDPKTRFSQTEILSSQVNEEKNRLKMVAGDFNSPSAYKSGLSPKEQKDLEDKGESLQRFVQLTHLKNAEGEMNFYTMPSWNPIKKIDHVFYDSSQLKLMEEGTIPNLLASDHLPAWAILRVK